MEVEKRIIRTGNGDLIEYNEYQRRKAYERYHTRFPEARRYKEKVSLTREQEVSIRRRLANGEKLCVLAREFGVGHGRIQLVARKA